MKRLISLMMCAVSLGAAAQSTITYPYNPDGNADALIGVTDLQDMLSAYGGAFSPSEIQVDGVGLLQVIQDMQNQLNAMQSVDVNYYDSMLTSLQQEVYDLKVANDTLTAQILNLQNAGFTTESWVNDNYAPILVYDIVWPNVPGQYVGQLMIDQYEGALDVFWIWTGEWWISQERGRACSFPGSCQW